MLFLRAVGCGVHRDDVGDRLDHSFRDVERNLMAAVDDDVPAAAREASERRASGGWICSSHTLLAPNAWSSERLFAQSCPALSTISGRLRRSPSFRRSS